MFATTAGVMQYHSLRTRHAMHWFSVLPCFAQPCFAQPCFAQPCFALPCLVLSYPSTFSYVSMVFP